MTASATCRILIVDDHPVVRRGLSQILNEETDLRVEWEADDAQTALKLIDDETPDVAIVDISLGGMDGIELLKHMKSKHAELAVLVVSIHDESLYAERVLRAGGLGYLNKAAAAENIVEAVRRVHAGKVYLGREIADQLLQNVVGGADPKEESSIDRLSDRELEVYRLIGSGLRTREIADRLHLSVKTIETYRENIKSKLGFANSNEMVRHAVLWVLEEN